MIAGAVAGLALKQAVAGCDDCDVAAADEKKKEEEKKEEEEKEEAMMMTVSVQVVAVAVAGCSVCVGHADAAEELAGCLGLVVQVRRMLLLAAC